LLSVAHHALHNNNITTYIHTTKREKIQSFIPSLQEYLHEEEEEEEEISDKLLSLS
jgi:hypothetical protein